MKSVLAVCSAVGVGMLTSSFLTFSEEKQKKEHINEEIQNKIGAACLKDGKSTIEYETWYDYTFYPPSGTWRDYLLDRFDYNLSHARKIHPNNDINLLKITFDGQDGWSDDETMVKVVYQVSAKN